MYINLVYIYIYTCKHSDTLSLSFCAMSGGKSLHHWILHASRHLKIWPLLLKTPTYAFMVSCSLCFTLVKPSKWSKTSSFLPIVGVSFLPG